MNISLPTNLRVVEAAIYLNATNPGPFSVVDDIDFVIWYDGFTGAGEPVAGGSAFFTSVAGVAAGPQEVAEMQNVTEDLRNLRLGTVEVITNGLGTNVQADFVFRLRA